MKYKVIVRPEAEDDLMEAFSWYEDKRIGLGHNFLLQFDAGINFIKRNPAVHPTEYRETRKHLIKRFPYKNYIEGNKIIVLAVIHGKRSPELIKKRINAL